MADSSGYRARGKTTALLDRNMSKPCLFLKHITYFENLTDPRDWARLNHVLAELSGRKVEEFEQSSVTMDPFIRERSE